MPSPFSHSNLLHFKVFDLSHGVFYDRHPANIPPGGCSAVNNLLWTDGYIRPRPGLSNVYPDVDNNEVVLLSHFIPFTGETRLLRVSKGTGTTTMHIHYYTTGTGWVRVTPLAGIANALSSDGEPPSAVNFDGMWFIAPGNVGLYYYDGTTFATVASAIADVSLRPFDVPKYVTSSESRLFIANTLDSTSGGTRIPYRLAWCDKGNPFVWSTGGGEVRHGTARFDDLPKASEPITGIYGGPNSTILVFKPTHVFVGNPVGSPMYFEFLLLQRGPGCIAHATIKEWRDGKILYLGDDNIYLQIPGQKPEAVGDRIRARLSEYSVTIQLSQAKAWIDRDDDLICFIVPEAVGAFSGQTLRQFTLSLRNGSWWEGVYSLGGDYITATHEFRSGTWQAKVLLGTKNGKIYESSFTNLLDVASDIPVSWTSGIFQISQLVENRTEQASIQQLRMYAMAGRANLAIYYGNNFDRFALQVFGEQICDGVSNVAVPNRITGENFKATIYSSQASAFPSKLCGLSMSLNLQGNTR